MSENGKKGRELLFSRIDVLGIALGVSGEKVEWMNMSIPVVTGFDDGPLVRKGGFRA